MRFISIWKPAKVAAPTPELIEKMGKLVQEGMKEGWLIATDGVQAGTRGMRVQSAGGKVTVTDGPFTEAKELIGGYALMQAKSREEMLELTKRFLAMAGDGECHIEQLYEQPPG